MEAALFILYYAQAAVIEADGHSGERSKKAKESGFNGRIE